MIATPENQFDRISLTISRLIDKVVGEWSGQLFKWLIIPMVAGLTYEVLARYAFNAPTIWAYDLTYMLYGSHFMLGATYTLYTGGHIRTDVFRHKWSVRTQGAVDAVLYLVFFFPGMFFFCLAGWDNFLHSYAIGETSDASSWRPVLYPLKFVVPFSAFLLMIQGISEFLKSVHAFRWSQWP
jgi:TRAP-type mannitol/chloroaromatic compound transport system permease small subunit